MKLHQDHSTGGWKSFLDRCWCWLIYFLNDSVLRKKNFYEKGEERIKWIVELNFTELLIPFWTFFTTFSKRLIFDFYLKINSTMYFSFLLVNLSNLLRSIFFLPRSVVLLLGRCIAWKKEYRYCRKLLALVSFYNPSNIGLKASIYYDKLIIKLYPFIAPLV